MSLHIINPGLQTTVQAGARRGLRHWGVPYSGPADNLSMSLANRCVGNRIDASALEVTYGQFEATFKHAAVISLMGAPASASIDNTVIDLGVPIHVKADATLLLNAPSCGVRTYLAIRGGIIASSFLGSCSTYLPARFGGLDGRCLEEGDELTFGDNATIGEPVAIPKALHVESTSPWRLRLHRGPELSYDSERNSSLYTDTFKVTQRANRMGFQMDGPMFEVSTPRDMKSVPVFPGTVQYPADGKPFVLMCDAQTTGGYPRIGQIARVDRHKTGQIRPGDTVRFLEVSTADAVRALAMKQAMFERLGLRNVL